MIYGYARVSTLGQATDGNGLEVQEQALRDHGATVIYSDHFTGVSTARPELQALLDVVEAGDTIIVTKLDRVARSVAAGVALIDDILARGVRLHILNMGVMDNTPSGRLIRTVMLAFSEFERDMIVERTTEAKAMLRATDPTYREGRPPKEPADFPNVWAAQQRGELTVDEGRAKLGIGRSTWYKLAARQESSVTI